MSKILGEAKEEIEKELLAAVQAEVAGTSVAASPSPSALESEKENISLPLA